METSLRLLKTDYIDVYQFHNPAFCPKPGDGTGLYEAMEEAKRQGKIRFIGITNHRLGVAEEAAASGLYDTLQFPFCYLATERDIALVNLCKENHVGFISMKGLSGGSSPTPPRPTPGRRSLTTLCPSGACRGRASWTSSSPTRKSPKMDGELKAVIEKDRNELIGNFCRACGYCMPCPAGIVINQCARMSQLSAAAPPPGG